MGTARRLGMLAMAAVIAAGCGASPASPSDAEQVSGDVAEARDGSFTVPLPDGWVDRTEEIAGGQASVSLVLQHGEQDIRQVFASTYDTSNGAEDAAIYDATGFATSYGVACERLEGDDPLGAPGVVLSCPFVDQPVPFVKAFVVFVDGDRSARLLLQAEGTSLEAAAKQLRPLVAGFAWQG